MSKELLINVSEGEECRIALLEDDKLEELYMERTSSTSHVGNIYKGRVTNVEPSIQAAFIDFGLGRNGFLHISDLMPTYFGHGGDDRQESVGRKMARRDRPPIQRCLRRGDDIIVQIIKEGIGTKGPTLTTYLSIPGRVLVMMPGMENFGVSRKIEDEDERRRLRGILDSLTSVEGVGFIIRTAGMGKTKAEIQRDLTYLTRLWQQIQKQAKDNAPVELYTEGDLVSRTVRDVYTTDIDRIIVDNKDVAKRVKEIIKLSAPRTKNKVELYEDPIPLFHKFGIEREIEQMYSRHVPLPSGGSLVIDSTEAVVAIDVNSGKFRDHSDAEMTAYKTDMEAADEIPRQLKLRDLGGVIICDFIDLRYERHRRDLEKRLHDNFRRDRAKTKVLRMSQFGIIELTRQRMRPSLKRSIYFDCPHCKGAGLVKTQESMSLDVMRRLAIAANDQRVARIDLAVCADVAFYLQNKKRVQLGHLEEHTNKRIVIRQDDKLGLDEMRMELYDERDGRVYLDELGMTPEHAQDDRHRGQPQGRRDQRGRDDRGRGDQHRQDRRPPQQQQPPKSRDRDRDEDEFEKVEDSVEDREEHFEEEGNLPLPVPPRSVAPTRAPAPVRAPAPARAGAAHTNGEPAAAQQGGRDDQQIGGDGRPKRRRRGRRGGRNRNRQPQPTDNALPPVEVMSSAQAEEHREEIIETVEEEREHEQLAVEEGQSETETAEPSTDEKPKRRRRGRRGGRRSRERREATAGAKTGEAKVATTNDIATAPVVRTGSTDKHQLVEDIHHEEPEEHVEPVEPAETPRRTPTRRPPSRRDLDAIPDDFDE